MSLKKFIYHPTQFLFKTLHQLSLTALPATCVLCGAKTLQEHNLCLACSKILPILPHSCVQCAQFLLGSPTLSRCGKCLRTPPSYAATFALFPYTYPIEQLIIHLKFREQLTHAKLFGELLTEKIRYAWYSPLSLPDLIIPMPLHPQRLRERGFNQAVEIARPISTNLKIAMDVHGVQRIRHTTQQSGLSATARAQNVAKAFICQQDYTNQHVAILDDVITTGHTIRACSEAILKQGAKRIDVWCCARRG